MNFSVLNEDEEPYVSVEINNKDVIVMKVDKEKTNNLLNSFIKPYEDRIKLLENQVASLSEIILTLTNYSPISPNITPINNNISEDPI
jgi:hypothetical protein